MIAKPATIYCLILIVLSIPIIGLDLGSGSLHNQDEARHAVVAREAAVQGHWLPLTYNGQPYYNKPPLRIWLTALTFKLAGIDEWSVRLGSAVFGLATVMTLFLVGRRLWGERVAFLSALILLTSHQYIYNHCVRTGETDSMLIFSWTAALLLLQLAVQEGSRKILYLAAVCLGLCGMVKHLGFVPIVMSIAIGYVLVAGAWREFPLRTWSTALGICLVVTLPWHLLIWGLEGKAFVQQYLLGEVVEKRFRAQGGGTRLLPRGKWASLVTMARGFFPWSCLLPFAFLAILFRDRFRRQWSMPALWLLVAVVSTVISGRKFSWYVLPAFPAAAIFVGALLDRFLDEASSTWARTTVVVGSLVAFASVTNAARHNPFEVLARKAMLAVNFLGHLRATTSNWPSVLAGFLALTALTILAYWLLGLLPNSRRIRQLARTGLVATLAGLALYTVAAPLRFRHSTVPFDDIARAADLHLAEGETLNVTLPRRKRGDPIFNFYLGSQDLRIRPATEMKPGAMPGELLLTDVATLEKIRKTSPEMVLRLQPLARAKGLLLLRLPEK